MVKGSIPSCKVPDESLGADVIPPDTVTLLGFQFKLFNPVVTYASVAHGVKKFVFASSSEVYGEPNSNPISETHDTKGKTV